MVVDLAPSAALPVQGQRREATMARRFAVVYLLYGAIAVGFLAVKMPPFQNPDELSHFLRAAQIADGGLIGSRFSRTEANGESIVTAGGLADPAIVQSYLPFLGLAFHPEARVTPQLLEQKVRWSGQRALEAFPNTAIDPPLFYAPAALGVVVGRAARMTVLQTLVLSRLVTGVVALSVGAVAIAAARGMAPWMFALLTLPMSLAMTASASQDAMILAVAALAGSLLVRASRWRDESNPAVLTGLAIALGLIATARLPYGVLALLPLALTGVRLTSRVKAMALAIAIFVAWSGVATVWAMTNFGAAVGADPAAQMAYLKSAPLVVLAIAKATLSRLGMAYVEGFIGRLGWSDTIFSPVYYKLALAVLGLAAVASALRSTGERISAGSRLLIVTALSIAAAGVFGATYLCWTVPGELVVTGVQGRYFLPLALAGAAVIPAFGGSRWQRPHQALVAIVLAFPVITLATVMHGIVARYYLN